MRDDPIDEATAPSQSAPERLGAIIDVWERRGLATALVTLCIGGGQGIATILERV